MFYYTAIEKYLQPLKSILKHPSHKFILGQLVETDKHKTLKVKLIKTHNQKKAVFLYHLQKLFSVKKDMESESFESSLLPPSVVEKVKGIKLLQKEAFNCKTNVPGIKVKNQDIYSITKVVKSMTLRIPGIQPIADLAENDQLFNSHKLVLFHPDKLKTFRERSPKKDAITSLLKEKNLDLNSSLEWFNVDLGYRNFNYTDILKAILPENCENVAGYSTIGHILHLNLREEVLAYKNIIGEVLLDKVSTARTVVNKTNSIDTTFRFFHMEVLAGEENFITETKEGGISYKMDFSKVYWNPRLGTEHERVVKYLEKGDVVYDMFAGIGPFAVRAAKQKKALVYANDLNPESFKWLKYNMENNKVAVENWTFNKDGRDFAKDVIKSDLVKRWSNQDCVYLPKYHIIMNLPAMAIEFLDVFDGLLEEYEATQFCALELPKIYCYCFSSAEDTHLDARCRTEAALGHSLPDRTKIRFVRNVAPYKDMLCVVFQLTEDILFNKTDRVDSPKSKKQKIATTEEDSSNS